MFNSLFYRRNRGTMAQLMIFAALMPFIAIILGIVLDENPLAQSMFISGVLDIIPCYSEIQSALLGYETVGDGFIVYLNKLSQAVISDIEVLTYIGMWVSAFDIIFKEWIKIPGLPILQKLTGLMMGALTVGMISDQYTRLMATGFLLILNYVLIMMAEKEKWQKIIHAVFAIPLKAYQTFLLSSYVAALCMIFQGRYTSVMQAVISICVPTLLSIVFMVAEYLIVVKK